MQPAAGETSSSTSFVPGAALEHSAAPIAEPASHLPSSSLTSSTSSTSADTIAKRPADETDIAVDSASANKRLRASDDEPGVPEHVIKKSGDKSSKKGKGSRNQKAKGGDDNQKSSGWARRGTRPDGAAAATGSDVENKTPRLPKRQCAILLGFCGSGYSGMQFQPDVETIEGTLFRALVKVGAISQDNSDDPVKVNLARAARTDAGVHAAGNVVSIKAIIQIPGVDDLVSKINEELPPQIRVWSVLRAVNSFNARLRCDSRKYTYYFPSYLLIPPKPREDATESSPTLSSGLTSDADLAEKRRWRVGEEKMSALRLFAKKFLGTHNFHNFTVEKNFKDASAKRHMKSIHIADPVVHGETEWISVLIHGQSFMLHQRKMMAILVLCNRSGTPPKVLDEMFGPKTVFVPKMPSLGLLLECPIFESYNEKTAPLAKLPLEDPEYRPQILFDLHEEQMETLKQQHIYSTMRATEDKFGLFNDWLSTIDKYKGGDLSYLSSEGGIPDHAIVRKGVKRNNPFRELKRFDANKYEKVVPMDQDTAYDDEQVDPKNLDEMEG